jgi:hypothetical protein
MAQVATIQARRSLRRTRSASVTSKLTDRAKEAAVALDVAGGAEVMSGASLCCYARAGARTAPGDGGA